MSRKIYHSPGLALLTRGYLWGCYPIEYYRHVPIYENINNADYYWDGSQIG
ncbi:MAG: hypothetical protein GY845_02395 [Planctomycetes bacterium]|nr:hypothetical protein [Planctomycetota bacterium]